MGRRFALLLVAGCGGHHVPATGGRPSVRLVLCAPALPPPTTTADQLLGAAIGDGAGDRPSVGRIRATVSVGGSRAGATVVSFGTPSITGALGQGAIVHALQHHLAELQACAAQQRPASGPEAPVSSKAVVLWRFTIGATGKVIHADAASHVLVGALTSCVTDVIRGATFPAPPDGRVVQVNLPLVFDSTGAPAEPVPANPARGARPWTPFALDPAVQPDAADEIARATEGALRLRLAAVAACFAGSSITGSLRAMLEVDGAGELTSIRIGGLGDQAVERCVGEAIAGARVIAPRSDAAEIACDLSRGDARPWRVTPDAGYGLIEASRTKLRYGDRSLVPGSDPSSLDERRTFVIVADPDTAGGMLALALAWAYDGEAALVAVRSPAANQPPDPPVFLGLGRTATSDDRDGDPDAVRAMLEVDATAVTGCVRRANPLVDHKARLSDPAAVGELARRVAAKCTTLRCAATLVIALGKDALARDLVEVTAAARRAGFERVLLGGEPGCRSVNQEVDR